MHATDTKIEVNQKKINPAVDDLFKEINAACFQALLDAESKRKWQMFISNLQHQQAELVRSGEEKNIAEFLNYINAAKLLIQNINQLALTQVKPISSLESKAENKLESSPLLEKIRGVMPDFNQSAKTMSQLSPKFALEFLSKPYSESAEDIKLLTATVADTTKAANGDISPLLALSMVKNTHAMMKKQDVPAWREVLPQALKIVGGIFMVGGAIGLVLGGAGGFAMAAGAALIWAGVALEAKDQAKHKEARQVVLGKAESTLTEVEKKLEAAVTQDHTIAHEPESPRPIKK